MPGLFAFFVILFAGLIFSQLFNRLHLPYVTALVVAGVLVGPFGFDVVEIDPVIEFLASVGVVFLMFIAGSEIKTEALGQVEGGIIGLALINGLVPFGAGLLVGWLFGYSWVTSLVLGVIFISSSVAVIVPSLEAAGLLRSKVGELVLTATVFEDVGSLLLLSFFLQTAAQRSALPPAFLVPLVLVLLVLLRIVIPKLRALAHFGKRGDDLFESELRFVFVVLLAAAVVFEALGLHTIVAGFLIGMVLGDSVRGKVEHKIHTVAYGLFIPVFFLVIGMQMDLSILLRPASLALVGAIVVASVGSKLLSGWWGARLAGLGRRDRWLTGVVTIPSLSTTLAAAFTASEFGLLSDDLVSALIVLSVVTTLAAPLLVRWVLSATNGSAPVNMRVP